MGDEGEARDHPQDRFDAFMRGIKAAESGNNQAAAGYLGGIAQGSLLTVILHELDGVTLTVKSKGFGKLVTGASGRLLPVGKSATLQMRGTHPAKPRFQTGRRSAILNSRRRLEMNWNQIEGNWEQFKGKVQSQWGKLTNDDLDIIKGNRRQLAGRIQERYGKAEEEAEREIDTWLSRY
jgi:uncharacterized protein YjbJ (UPF0337 family)